MKRAKKTAHNAFGALTLLCALAAAGGLLYQIWAGYAAPPGHAFDASHLGMAIAWSGLVMCCVFGAVWAGTIE